MIKEVEVLKKRIAELERKVRELEARPQQQIHNHYHYPQPQWVPVTTYPIQPWRPIWYNTTSSSASTITVTNKPEVTTSGTVYMMKDNDFISYTS